MCGGEQNTLTRKPIRTPDDLSARDKAILDDFTSGTTRKALAAQHDVTTARIGQILHRPASVAYIAQRGGVSRVLLYAKAGEELLARMDWGGMKLGDLLALWKAAMPQELTVKDDQAAIDAAAERLAERTGIPKERAIVDIRERLKARAG